MGNTTVSNINNNELNGGVNMTTGSSSVSSETAKKLSDLPALSAMGNGGKLSRPVYIVSMENKVNKAGKNQINLKVKDGVSTENVSIFDADIDTLAGRYPFFENGKVATLTITRNDPFYNASALIQECTDEYDLTEIADKATDDPLKYMNYILNTVKKVSDDRKISYPEYDTLYDLVSDIYSERKSEMLMSSSATACHHTGLSGNIVHTAEVINMCDMLSKACIGKDIDKELLFAGAALHDVGKPRCYDTDAVGVATMTLEGIAMGGHHWDSLLAIEEAVKRGNYDKERIMLLMNMIASHHGAREYGDLATPMTIEAFWLRAMDDLDAKHYEARNVIKDLTPGTVSPNTIYPLKMNLYRRTDQEFM